jgi:predicted transposase YbfD/YdcC
VRRRELRRHGAVRTRQGALLRRFLRLPGGIPSHDTFSRIFRLLDPDAFEACFARYLGALSERVEGVVAIDGKTARRSFDRQNHRPPLHLISAWACEQRLVLGQRRVDDGANEIVALPELLALLALDGCIVTADAMHCQKDTAQAILARGGDYVLALKANQPALHEDVRLLLDDPDAPPDDLATTTDGDHGRIETRCAAVLYDVAWLAESHAFCGLSAVGKVTAAREQDGRTTTATRYYLLSRPLSAARFLAVVRAHWQIENRLHWVLDVVLDEDLARARKCARTPRPPVPLRPQRAACQPRAGLGGKIKRAGWDYNFVLGLLATALCDCLVWQYPPD